MALSDSNKRTIRTLVHSLVAAVTAAPTFLPWLVHATAGTPIAAHVATLAAALAIWVAVVAGLLNKAEDLGLIPTWLRDEVPSVIPAPVAINVHTSQGAPNIESAIADVKAALNKAAQPPASL